MGTLGGNGSLWWKLFSKGRQFSSRRNSQSSDSATGGGGGGGSKFTFPLKAATTAASLSLTGDTIAQLNSRWTALKQSDSDDKDVMSKLLSDYDWVRALRMSSYGFLLYGPGSYAWYQYLDHALPKPTVQNLLLKVLFNQIILGPCVIAVVFAWNNLWRGKLSELPTKYQKDALPTLLYGFRFWIPASLLNFWVIPLKGRVAFMSTCSIFWNFYLSSTMSKQRMGVYLPMLVFVSFLGINLEICLSPTVEVCVERESATSLFVGSGSAAPATLAQ